MTDTEYEPSSTEAIRRMMFGDRRAEFAFYETEDAAHGHRTESGAPCGSELSRRNGVRGWEVCGECLKNPLLKAALFLGGK